MSTSFIMAPCLTSQHKSDYRFCSPVLASSKDIHHHLDVITKECSVNSFYATKFNVGFDAKGYSGADIAAKLNIDIHETGIIEPEKLLIAYDGVDVDAIIENIIKGSQVKPSSTRDKFLLAALRGVGGGKTRMVEECRIRLGLLYPNWLPIAITFNHRAEICNEDYYWKNPDLIVSYAICSRILSSIFTIPISVAQEHTDAVLNSVKKDYAKNKKRLAIDLIVGTVSHVAERVRRDKPAVDSLVLFIDESVKLIEDAQFPKKGSDAFKTMRTTLLGKEVGEILNTGLVMTSLNVSVFGLTDLGCYIQPIALASKLSVEHIVNKIWIPSFNSSNVTATEDLTILRLLAATVNSAPRLMEIMGKSLQEQFENTWPYNGKGLTLNQSLDAILKRYETLKKAYYPRLAFPVGKHLHALINSKPVAFDAATLEYVRRSSFTNSITTFPRPGTDEIEVVPESALSLLADANLFKTLSVTSTCYDTEIKDELDHLWSQLKSHIQSPVADKGQALEDAFSSVLRMRILSMHLKDGSMKGQTNLLDLLAIDMKKVLFTVGGRPYNVAKTTPHKGFEQDGVLKSAADWMSNTFELGQKTASTMKKNEQLKHLFVAQFSFRQNFTPCLKYLAATMTRPNGWQISNHLIPICFWQKLWKMLITMI